MPHSTRPVEVLLGALAAALCLATAVVFWRQVPLFPLPGLYLIEIAIVGVVSLFALACDGDPARTWRSAPWAAAGILAAFGVLGMWTIGVMLAPAALCLVTATVLADRRTAKSVSSGVTIFLLTAVVQGGFLWALFNARQ